MDNTRTKADPARRTCTFYSPRENDSTITVSIWGEVATNAVLAEAHHDGPIATEQMRVFPTQAPRRRAHACTWLQQLMKSHCVLAGLTDCLRLQFNFDEKGLSFFTLQPKTSSFSAFGAERSCATGRAFFFCVHAWPWNQVVGFASVHIQEQGAGQHPYAITKFLLIPQAPIYRMGIAEFDRKACWIPTIRAVVPFHTAFLNTHNT